VVTSCSNDASIRPPITHWKQELRRDVAMFGAGVEEMLSVALQTVVIDVLDLLVGQLYKRHIVFVPAWILNAA
jgi:hypothetical protein